MQEHRIFPTLVYSASLAGLAVHRRALVNDVLALVAATDVEPEANRTRELLTDRPEPHWRAYFAGLDGIVDRVASDLHPRWTCRSAHSWGLVFRSTDDWPSNFRSLHAHAQATFSTVCYLDVPPELVDAGAGGTLLRNPLANVHHRYYDVDYIRFDPVELGVVVFPGFLEHLPERPDGRVDFSRPRVVVATDFCFY